MILPPDTETADFKATEYETFASKGLYGRGVECDSVTESSAGGIYEPDKRAEN
jgi:hypothetical protein